MCSVTLCAHTALHTHASTCSPTLHTHTNAIFTLPHKLTVLPTLALALFISLEWFHFYARSVNFTLTEPHLLTLHLKRLSQPHSVWHTKDPSVFPPAEIYTLSAHVLAYSCNSMHSRDLACWHSFTHWCPAPFHLTPSGMLVTLTRSHQWDYSHHCINAWLSGMCSHTLRQSQPSEARWLRSLHIPCPSTAWPLHGRAPWQPWGPHWPTKRLSLWDDKYSLNLSWQYFLDICKSNHYAVHFNFMRSYT